MGAEDLYPFLAIVLPFMHQKSRIFAQNARCLSIQYFTIVTKTNIKKRGPERVRAFVWGSKNKFLVALPVGPQLVSQCAGP